MTLEIVNSKYISEVTDGSITNRIQEMKGRNLFFLIPTLFAFHFSLLFLLYFLFFYPLNTYLLFSHSTFLFFLVLHTLPSFHAPSSSPSSLLSLPSCSDRFKTPCSLSCQIYPPIFCYNDSQISSLPLPSTSIRLSFTSIFTFTCISLYLMYSLLFTFFLLPS